jgi:hypothetical protein
VHLSRIECSEQAQLLGVEAVDRSLPVEQRLLQRIERGNERVEHDSTISSGCDKNQKGRLHHHSLSVGERESGATGAKHRPGESTTLWNPGSTSSARTVRMPNASRNARRNP